jgi:hypothetical protein
VSPSEATLRLKNALLDGKLEKLGALNLKIGGQSVNIPSSSSSSASSPLIIGSSTAAAVVVFFIFLWTMKYKRNLCQTVSQHEAPPPPPTFNMFKVRIDTGAFACFACVARLAHFCLRFHNRTSVSSATG